MQLFKEIKYAYQRVTRGYSDRDAWDLRHWMGTVMPGILRTLKARHCGCPIEFYDDANKNHECAKWEEALEEMAQAFEVAKNIDDAVLNWRFSPDGTMVNISHDDELNKQLTTKMEKGLTLFVKHYVSLWD